MDKQSQFAGITEPLVAKLTRVRDQRAMVMNFLKPVTYVFATREEAAEIIEVIRLAVSRWFGSMRYAPEELRTLIVCSPMPNEGRIKVEFLPNSLVSEQGALAANPEVFLSLADHMEEALNALPRLN